MKLSDHVKMSPACIPVGSIPFRGKTLDIFAPTGEDLCWLLSQSGSIQGALDQAADGVGALLESIATSGPHILRRLLSIATAMPEEDLPAAHLIFAEQQAILIAMFEMGVPDALRGKLLAIAGAWLAGMAANLSQESAQPSSTSGSASSKSSDPTDTTPTA